MNIHVEFKEEKGIEHTFYKGPASDCPPLPRVGEILLGTFGHMEVKSVAHCPQDLPHAIRINYIVPHEEPRLKFPHNVAEFQRQVKD
jgi:hypothetical protein